MKIERLSQDKIRVFLTFDDLMERGIHKEDMWNVIPRVRELFSDMMDQAYAELGFDANGPLAVEVFALPAQGMVVIVTRGGSASSRSADGDDDMEMLDDDTEVFEMEVTLEQLDTISYAFRDFEHVLGACRLLRRHLPAGGRLYSYKESYILHFDPDGLPQDVDVQAVVAILSEYGEAASVTEAVLDEYGRVIIADDAVAVLCSRFG